MATSKMKLTFRCEHWKMCQKVGHEKVIRDKGEDKSAQYIYQRVASIGYTL